MLFTSKNLFKKITKATDVPQKNVHPQKLWMLEVNFPSAVDSPKRQRYTPFKPYRISELHKKDVNYDLIRYTVKKIGDFPVPSRNVTNQTFPGLVSYCTSSRLGTGKSESPTLFYSVSDLKYIPIIWVQKGQAIFVVDILISVVHGTLNSAEITIFCHGKIANKEENPRTNPHRPYFFASDPVSCMLL